MKKSRGAKGDGSPCERAWEWFDQKGFNKHSELDEWLQKHDSEFNDYMEECADQYPWEPEDTFTTQDAYRQEPLRPKPSIRRDLQQLVKQGKLQRVKRGVYRRINSMPPKKENLTTSLFRSIIRFLGG